MANKKSPAEAFGRDFDRIGIANLDEAGAKAQLTEIAEWQHSGAQRVWRAVRNTFAALGFISAAAVGAGLATGHSVERDQDFDLTEEEGREAAARYISGQVEELFDDQEDELTPEQVRRWESGVQSPFEDVVEDVIQRVMTTGQTPAVAAPAPAAPVSNPTPATPPVTPASGTGAAAPSSMPTSQ